MFCPKVYKILLHEVYFYIFNKRFVAYNGFLETLFMSSEI